MFTPDSITNSFKDSNRKVKEYYKTEKEIIDSYSKKVKVLLKQYDDIDYTIGSSIIFPICISDKKIKWTMNIARGVSHSIHDRFDYTLECIKRYYEGNKNNPLQSALEESSEFFKLFNDFNEYVKFFFLDDLINDIGNVISFTDKIDFSNPFPLTEDEYIKYINNTINFINNRNKRIEEWCNNYK